jgi:hypothetical protein
VVLRIVAPWLPIMNEPLSLIHSAAKHKKYFLGGVRERDSGGVT